MNSNGNGSSGRPANGAASNGISKRQPDGQYGYSSYSNGQSSGLSVNSQHNSSQSNQNARSNQISQSNQNARSNQNRQPNQSSNRMGGALGAQASQPLRGLPNTPFPENSSSNSLVNTSATGEYFNPVSERFNVQQELDRIEEIVLESTRVPVYGKTLISEDELLDQLDVVRVNLPAAVQESVQIVQEREEILNEAEQYAQEIVAAAEKQAAAILNEMSIIRQAEAQAAQLRTQTEQECDALRAQTLGEIEQLQNQARQEWEETRSRTVTEAKTIQEDADTYADQVLGNMEQQFMEMLHILRNGRQQIQGGQALDMENVAPQSQINPATGAARPVSRREVSPMRSPNLDQRPPMQPRSNQLPNQRP